MRSTASAVPSAYRPHNLRYVQVPADSVRELIQHVIDDRTG